MPVGTSELRLHRAPGGHDATSRLRNPRAPRGRGRQGEVCHKQLANLMIDHGKVRMHVPWPRHVGDGTDIGQEGLDSRWVGQLSPVKLYRSSLAQSIVAEMCPRDRQEHWEVIVPTGGQIDVMTLERPHRPVTPTFWDHNIIQPVVVAGARPPSVGTTYVVLLKRGAHDAVSCMS